MQGGELSAEMASGIEIISLASACTQGDRDGNLGIESMCDHV